MLKQLNAICRDGIAIFAIIGVAYMVSVAVLGEAWK